MRHLRELFGGGATGGLSDGALLARYAASRDPAAFEALVARHGPMVVATCRAVLKGEQDVEDAFQATFLVLARKAGSIRGGDALGGWLHRVARRAAMQVGVEARRGRRGDAEAIAMATPDNGRPGLEPDVRPILHEEIDRLPDRHRLPVVLCDLEGLSYEEAAGRLSWTVPTLRTRLAKARGKLRDRLARRGISTLVIASVLTHSAARAAVPASWTKAAVASATGGAAPAGAAVISGILIRGMLMTKMKIAASAAVAMVALASAGYVALASRPAEDMPKADAPKPEAANVAQAPAAKKPVETIEVRGIVLSHDGKPVAGAALRAGWADPAETAGSATSGPAGRFATAVPRRVLDGRLASFLPAYPWLIASADDFGPGGNEAPARGDPKAEQTIRLVAAGPAIEGRVVDLEGHPVAGARVATERLWYEPKGDLAGWIAKTRGGAVAGVWRDLQQFPAKVVATTGADGRFRLTGIGLDRVADLLVSGPMIATTQVYAMCRDEPEIRAIDKQMMTPKPFVVHAPQFDLAVAPSRPIEGVARDKDSGRPIAGLKIQGMVYEESSLMFAPGIEAATDAQGRYRLGGLPQAAAYRLLITPDSGQPYLRATLKVPAPSPAIEPIAFDIAMKSGVLIRGTITEKGTGKPAAGGDGSVEAFIFDDNTSTRDYPGAFSGYAPRVVIDVDGRFAIATMPGRGVLAVRAGDERYRGAVGFEKIRGYNAQSQALSTRPHWVPPRGYQAVVEVDPQPGSEPVTLDIQVDPGRSVAIHAVDPDGKPVGDTQVKGVGETFATSPYPKASADFEVHALDPSRPRRVVITHEGRKLIGSVCLKGEEAGPITVKLQPWVTIVGRIVDAEGKPMPGMRLSATGGSEQKHPEDSDILPGGDWNGGLILGNDGKFRVEGLVPGLKYDGSASNSRFDGGVLFEGLVVPAGGVKDLGDLKPIPPKAANPQ